MIVHAREITMRPMPPESDPDRAAERGELARLAHGLERHVRRRSAAGRRATPRPRRSSAPARDLGVREAEREARLLEGEARSSARAAPIPERVAQNPERADSTPHVERELAPDPSLLRPARDADDVRRQAAAARDLEELRSAVARCEACGLCKTRTQTVFMDGRGSRRVLFIGEAPGAEEDRRGVPFVGRAGQLLTDIITKGMGLAREDVRIANVLKCRPPDNRDPTTEEKAICTPWLDRQVELLDPEVILPLGRHAAMHVLGTTASMNSMRGRVHERKGRKIVATFHPAYLLRNPADKKECWKDIQIAMGLLGIAPPATRGAPSASGPSDTR
jgi:DNA polymerase